MFTDERSANMLLHRPSDWEAIVHPEAELVVAAPLAPWMAEGGFRPNVTVTTFAFTGTVTQLSTVVMASLLTSLADPYLLSVDPVPQLDAGRAGQHLLTVTDERASLEPATTALAYRHLLSAFMGD